MLAACFGYVVLVGASDWEDPDGGTGTPLDERLQELGCELDTLMSDVEQFRTEHRANGTSPDRSLASLEAGQVRPRPRAP